MTRTRLPSGEATGPVASIFMLLALVAIAAGIVAGWLSGRRLPTRRRRRQWHAVALLVGGGVMVLAGGRALGGTAGLVLLAVGYGLLVLFATANVRRPGLVLVAVGLVANLAVVLTDHGMPVRGLPAGVAAAGHHHGLSSRDQLTALADTIHVAALHETISPGDVLVALGGAVGFFAWLEPRPRRTATGAPATHAATDTARPTGGARSNGAGRTAGIA
jgi:hypothetical protein